MEHRHAEDLASTVVNASGPHARTLQDRAAPSSHRAEHATHTSQALPELIHAQRPCRRRELAQSVVIDHVVQELDQITRALMMTILSIRVSTSQQPQSWCIESHQ
jgi:hypothetical protein